MQSATAAPERRSRPAVVTTAGMLMLLVALLGVVSAVVGLAVMGDMRRAVLDALGEQGLGQDADAAAGFVTAAAAVGAGFSVLVAVTFGVLAFFVLRGANPARITTWVVAGLFLLCGFCGLAFSSLGAVAPPSGDAESNAVARAVEDATPAWYGATSLAITVAQVLCYIAIIVLLALPASNAYFAKPVPQWQPPYGPGGSTPYPPPQYPAGMPPQPSPGPQPGAWGPGGQPPEGGQPPAPGAWGGPPPGDTPGGGTPPEGPFQPR